MLGPQVHTRYGNLFTLDMPVCRSGLMTFPLLPQICIGNSDTTEAAVTFTGDLSFPDLVSEQHVAVSSSYGELLAVRHSLPPHMLHLILSHRSIWIFDSKVVNILASLPTPLDL
jgi:hypothetical protein